MHAECSEWLDKVTGDYDWEGAWVIEVGSLDVNGRARDHVPPGWVEWHGIDLLDGPGVDQVGDAAVILNNTPLRFDIAVCCEVLEHAPRWGEILHAMLDVLNPGGLLFVTCAGTGRPPHAADGSGPPRTGEWYHNVPAIDVWRAIEGRADFLYRVDEYPPGDTRIVARKR